MKVSSNFTLEELFASQEAKVRGIDNTPSPSATANLRELAVYMLQPIRDVYGKPVKVNSGFRCEKLNAIIGGSPSSSHKYGYAADIKPADGNMRELQRRILEWAKTNKFDQIIIEQPVDGVAKWIHVGWKRGSDGTQRKQILSAKKVNGRWQYFPVKPNSKYYSV